ncbi:hypothetical protein [Domibacillus mangrovi]|uniref:Uncharacterized protein n=1 Tax=Domibacillus mangrovi TaxID=1714354 RepID=A0A1Q5P3D5_9BACI|nr:hypothetical protein [Domibacillus mangrovi]OKL36683.1 hypothetical protein BLL40_08065 [Domibacillus mangrovi]
MYKKISSFNFASLRFNEDIDTQFKIFTNKFITEFENSILESFVFHASPLTYDERERDFLRKILKPSNVFPIELDRKTGLEILDILLTIKLEDYLRVPFNHSKNEEQKEKVTDLMSFEEYVGKKDKNSRDSLEKQMKELKIFEDGNFDRPPYFLLYRARNIVASRLKNRSYTIKALNKFVFKLKEGFELYLYDKIMADNLHCLDDNDKNSIYHRLENELLNGFLNDFRLGKTEEEGNKLVFEIKRKLEEASISERIKELMWSSYIKELERGKVDNLLVGWTRTFKEELEKNFLTLKVGNDVEDLEFHHFPLPVDSIKKILLAFIFKEDNFTELIQSAFQGIENVEKTKLINQLHEEYLQKNNFSVALCVKNIKTDENFLNSKLNPFITVMSNEMFKSWQYELYPNEGAKRLFLDNGGLENTTWFIVDDVQCAVSDTDQAYHVAREKLKNLLNFLFHFISREDQINYEIVDPYLIFNHDTKSWTMGRMLSPGIADPKNIDDLEIDLLKFTNNFFEVHSLERDLVIKAINCYIKICKTDDVEEKMQYQSEIFKILFQTHDIQELSTSCAIIVAGTNYDKNDVTYGEMRRWLIEDFHEFFYIADRKGFIPLKMQINERFMVFCKIIIRTILFNLIPINKDSQYSVKDVIEWILTINPNKDPIVRGNM